jgi:hypothetical protein
MHNLRLYIPFLVESANSTLRISFWKAPIRPTSIDCFVLWYTITTRHDLYRIDPSRMVVVIVIPRRLPCSPRKKQSSNATWRNWRPSPTVDNSTWHNPLHCLYTSHELNILYGMAFGILFLQWVSQKLGLTVWIVLAADALAQTKRYPTTCRRDNPHWKPILCSIGHSCIKTRLWYVPTPMWRLFNSFYES